MEYYYDHIIFPMLVKEESPNPMHLVVVPQTHIHSLRKENTIGNSGLYHDALRTRVRQQG
jgi:hypothetical protein